MEALPGHTGAARAVACMACVIRHSVVVVCPVRQRRLRAASHVALLC